VYRTRTLRALQRPETFSLFFGEKQFVPMINSAMVFAPPQVFAHLAYNVFYFLFNWSDSNWVVRSSAFSPPRTPVPPGVNPLVCFFW